MTESTIVIVGSGVSGMSAAVSAAQKGISITLISNAGLAGASSLLDQEGLNAVMPWKNDGDSIERHFEESIETSQFLARQDFVRHMCEEAPRFVSYLERIGLLFSRSATGAPLFKKLKDHSHPRTLFCEERTGFQISQILNQQVRRFEKAGLIQRREGWEFLSVVIDQRGVCRGITAMDRTTMEIKSYPADAVVMASGSYGGLCMPSKGGYFCDGSAAGALYGQGVFLANLEFTGTGGIWVDHRQMTNIEGLFAVGSASMAYQGAQSLPGNRLLSNLHSGFSLVDSSVHYISSLENKVSQISPDLFLEEIRRQHFFNQTFLDRSGNENLYELKTELGDCITQYAGVNRSEGSLKKGEEKIRELDSRLKKLNLSDHSNWRNHELLDARRFYYMLDVALAVVKGALLRRESRGTHQREDYPKRDDRNFLKTTKIAFTPLGPEIEYEDIHLKYLKPQAPALAVVDESWNRVG